MIARLEKRIRSTQSPWRRSAGHGDRLRGALGQDLGIGAGLVVGNGLQVVSEAEKGPQFVIDTCVASDQSMELCIDPAMRLQ